jgi:hypothetical protein
MGTAWDGVRTTGIWRRVLGVEPTVIEPVELEADGQGGVDLGTTRVYLQAQDPARGLPRALPKHGAGRNPHRADLTTVLR